MESTSQKSSPENKLLASGQEARKNELVEMLDLERLRDDDAFDRIANAAASVCKTTGALVTLIGRDQQFTLGSVGSDIDIVPREESFCTYTLQSDEPLITPDARQDERFENNPLVRGPTHLRFYAGARYKGPDCTPLGAVCALDSEPRDVDTVAQASLQALASQVERHIMTYLVSQGIELSDEWFEHTRPRGDDGFVHSVEDEARRLSRHITEIQADIMVSRFSEDDVSSTRERMLNWKIDRDIGRAQEKLVGMLEAARRQRESQESPPTRTAIGDVLKGLFGDVVLEEDAEVAVSSERDLWQLFQATKALIVSAGAVDIGQVELMQDGGEIVVTITVSGAESDIQRLGRVKSGAADNTQPHDAVVDQLNVQWKRVQALGRAVDASVLYMVEQTGDRARWFVRF